MSDLKRSTVVDAGSGLDPYVVTWNTPGDSWRDSMPLGNGDLGLNLWTEPNGDVVLLISKSDAWSENGQLLKLGLVRLSLSPSPFAGGGEFAQRLSVRDGTIEIAGDSGARLLVWVDADQPVIRLRYAGGIEVIVTASVELWRTAPRRTNVAPGNLEMEHGFWEWDGEPGGGLTIDPDIVLPRQGENGGDRVVWAHRNVRSRFESVFTNQHLESLLPMVADPFLHRTFGVSMRGDGLTDGDDRTLKSAKATSAFDLRLCASTEKSESIDAWRDALRALEREADAVPVERSLQTTRRWWQAFWKRSHVHITGNDAAAELTQAYVMHRWMTAASGRGAYPIKFNGSIFTTGQEPPAGTAYDADKGQQDADFRRWGGNYWFQNTRLIYWPMLASGDHDLLRPFFEMYLTALPLAAARVPLVHGHAGAAFPETMFFFGLPNNHDFGWGNPSREMINYYIRWHYNSGLELTAMLLDAFDHTRDDAFLQAVVLPLAIPLIQFFDEHAQRVNGKLHFEPAAALETRQWAITPAQDIAGLQYVLPQLLDLPAAAVEASTRAGWQRLVTELPPLPTGPTDAAGNMPATPADASPAATTVLWPAYDFIKCNNRENPELYSVYPFRVFGVGLPDLELARATFAARSNVGVDCWAQDGIHLACLGDAAGAKADAIAKFTKYGEHRFKWFGRPEMDWVPNMDNSSTGQLTVQNMLLQPRPGGKVLIFPAWPREWDVTFKLHVPRNTTIECTLQGGVVRSLVVTPPDRERDVIVMPPQ